MIKKIIDWLKAHSELASQVSLTSLFVVLALCTMFAIIVFISWQSFLGWFLAIFCLLVIIITVGFFYFAYHFADTEKTHSDA